MTEQEAENLVQLLLKDLSARPELTAGRTPQDDLVNAVQAEIAAGQPVQIKLKVRSDEVIDDPVAGRRRTEGMASGEFIQRRDFTSHEKLKILLEALGLSAIAPPVMANRVIKTLSDLSKDGPVQAVHLANERVPDLSREIAAQEVESAIARSIHLQSLLDGLMKEAIAEQQPIGEI
jgi:hypothetical protein